MEVEAIQRRHCNFYKCASNPDQHIGKVIRSNGRRLWQAL